MLLTTLRYFFSSAFLRFHTDALWKGPHFWLGKITLHGSWFICFSRWQMAKHKHKKREPWLSNENVDHNAKTTQHTFRAFPGKLLLCSMNARGGKKHTKLAHLIYSLQQLHYASLFCKLLSSEHLVWLHCNLSYHLHLWVKIRCWQLWSRKGKAQLWGIHLQKWVHDQNIISECRRRSDWGPGQCFAPQMGSSVCEHQCGSWQGLSRGMGRLQWHMLQFKLSLDPCSSGGLAGAQGGIHYNQTQAGLVRGSILTPNLNSSIHNALYSHTLSLTLHKHILQ